MPERACLPVVERHLDGSRLVLPATIRDTMGHAVAVSAELSGFVMLSPPGLWQEMLPVLQECGAVSAYATELFRFYAASEVCVHLDERGRVSLPSLHMEWARLCPNGLAVVVAIGRTAQVWDPRRLSVHLRMANRRLRSLTSHVLREQLSLLELTS